SIVSLMDVLYLVAAPSNNMVEGTGSEQPAAHHKRSVSGCNNSAGEPGKTETRLEESWRRCAWGKFPALTGPSRSLSGRYLSRAPDRCGSRCKRAASATAIRSPRRERTREFTTRGYPGMRWPARVNMKSAIVFFLWALG